MSERKQDRWQDGITSLKDGIAYIYKTKEFSDITFQVHGKSFPAHKLVLAARSPSFARHLLEETCEFEEIIVEEKSVTKTGFEILLRFIYTDFLGTTDKKDIIETYLAAVYYGQTALQNRCKDEISAWTITTNDVFMLLDVGSSIDMLKERCLHFIKSQANKVISSPSFVSASLQSLCTILQGGCLINVPPIKRIQQVMEWGAKRHSVSDNFSLVRKELLGCSLLGTLEFEKLSLAELRDVDFDYNDLLKPEEVAKFLKYDRSKNRSHLPEWCSSE